MMTRRTLILSILLLVAACASALTLYLSVGPREGDATAQLFAPSAGELMIAPDAIEFGEVPIGEIAHLSVIATNLGEDTITVERIDAARPYKVGRAGFALEAGASRELLVSFGSAEPGEFGGTALRIVTNSIGTVEVPLSAVVAEPQGVQVEPKTLRFGEVHVGQVASAMLTITNPGSRPLRISGIGAIPPFRGGDDLRVVEPRSSAVVEVFFRPEEVGEANGSFRIRSNDPDWPHFSVPLQGIGTAEEPNPRLIASNEALEFGQVSVGDVRRKWLAVTNRGFTPLTVRSVTAEPPFGGPASSRQIAPGGVYRFPVAFSPSAKGALLGALLIHSNDPDAEPLLVSLVGEGVAEGQTEYALEVIDLPYDVANRKTGDGRAGDDADSPYSHLPEWAYPQSNPPTSEGGSSTSAASEAATSGFSVDEGSKIAMGPRPADIGEMSFDSVTWDGEQLVIEGFHPPQIDFPFGRSFQFEPITGPIVSKVVDGDIVIEFDLVVTDGSTRKVIPFSMTTGNTEPVNAGENHRDSMAGHPMQGGKMSLVGAAKAGDEPNWIGWIPTIKLDVAPQVVVDQRTGS